MFSIKQIKNKKSDYIEIKDSDNLVFARIDLRLGGSLQELILDKETIISSKETLPYEESYASAILFPFANRIENGHFYFNDQPYQLHINKVEENNALHGLVYDKKFNVVHYSSDKNHAELHVRYIEVGEPKGFPFKYVLTLSYVIKKTSLELIVEVKNIDEFSFPFTIGWHPYFVSSNLEKSLLDLDCRKKIVVNEQKIPISEEHLEIAEMMVIGDKEFDDCFILNKNEVCFYTPDYKLDFIFSHDEIYLQLYTPPNRKTIAIEPQTGSANNFNDNRGLKTLHPHEMYDIRWKIKTHLNTT